MTILPLFEALPHMLSSIAINDNGIAVLGMLIGISGGFLFTHYKDQLKTRKAKIDKPEQKRDPKE